MKPTENLQAYDLYLRGKRYARRQTRQDLEFALQMFENAVAMDPNFALAYAGVRQRLRHFLLQLQSRSSMGGTSARRFGQAVALRWDLPEVQVSQAWVLYATDFMTKRFAWSARRLSVNTIAKAPTTCSAVRYFLPAAIRKL